MPDKCGICGAPLRRKGFLCPSCRKEQGRIIKKIHKKK